MIKSVGGSPHSCLLTRSSAQVTAQPITTGGTVKAVLWDTETQDLTGLHSTASNTDLITIAVPGIYLVTANIEWQGNVTGLRQVLIVKNGASVSNGDLRTPPSGNNFEMAYSRPLRLAAGDTLRVNVFQTSGVSLDVTANSTFSAVRIGD